MRDARPEEAGLLGDLALRSKGYWGYDQEFLDACREELTFTAEEVESRCLVVAAAEQDVLGFYGLDGIAPDGELSNLWVVPESIGTGLGRTLWRHAVDRARALGFTSLRIEADPQAEGFYLAMGAIRVGESPSGSIPGRVLPQLRYDLGE